MYLSTCSYSDSASVLKKYQKETTEEEGKLFHYGNLQRSIGRSSPASQVSLKGGFGRENVPVSGTLTVELPLRDISDAFIDLVGAET